MEASVEVCVCVQDKQFILLYGHTHAPVWWVWLTIRNGVDSRREAREVGVMEGIVG